MVTSSTWPVLVSTVPSRAGAAVRDLLADQRAGVAALDRIEHPAERAVQVLHLLQLRELGQLRGHVLVVHAAPADSDSAVVSPAASCNPSGCHWPTLVFPIAAICLNSLLESCARSRAPHDRTRQRLGERTIATGVPARTFRREYAASKFASTRAGTPDPWVAASRRPRPLRHPTRRAVRKILPGARKFFLHRFRTRRVTRRTDRARDSVTCMRPIRTTLGFLSRRAALASDHALRSRTVP